MKNILSPLTHTFIAVVEAGTITQAADDLAMAKSSISQNLRALEVGLNVKLIQRTTRRQRLTYAGEQYYRRCKQIITLAQLAADEVLGPDATPTGPIKVTAPHAMISPIIAPALARLIKKFPYITPKLVADDRRLDLIEHGLDVAITVGQLPDSSYTGQRIGDLEDVLCASPSFLTGYGLRGARLETVDFSKLPLVSHQRQGTQVSHQLIHKFNHQQLIINMRSSISANSIEAVAALARQGMGLAILPNFAIVNDLRQGGLLSMDEAFAFPIKPIYAVHAYGKMSPTAVAQFIAEVRDILHCDSTVKAQGA